MPKGTELFKNPSKEYDELLAYVNDPNTDLDAKDDERLVRFKQLERTMRIKAHEGQSSSSPERNSSPRISKGSAA